MKGRFQAPYLRDDLLTHGVMVETLETAAQWSDLLALRRGVDAAIEAALALRGTPGLAMCHISHVYETGASLYFTLIARQREGEELAQWREVKQAATASDRRRRRDDHPPSRRRARPCAVDGAGDRRRRRGGAARVKAELDPAGIMNPGKLLPVIPSA